MKCSKIQSLQEPLRSETRREREKTQNCDKFQFFPVADIPFALVNVFLVSFLCFFRLFLVQLKEESFALIEYRINIIRRIRETGAVPYDGTWFLEH